MKPCGHMINRPMEGLFESLKELDVFIEREKGGGIIVHGPAHSNKSLLIDCSKTTQYLSALMLAFADGPNLKFIEKNLSSSKGYVDLTKFLIQDFMKNDKESYKCPVDSSSLSYPLALASVYGKVLIENCQEVDPYQADSIILEHLKSMGAKISIDKGGLVCEKGDLKGIEFDGGLCPDIVPTLAFVASYAKGRTIIKNIGILRYKECDRIEALVSILDSFSVTYKLDGDTLTINGSGENTKKTNNNRRLDVPEDHRMVMVGSLFLFMNGGGVISNSQHISKSYPDFFKLFQA